MESHVNIFLILFRGINTDHINAKLILVCQIYVNSAVKLLDIYTTLLRGTYSKCDILTLPQSLTLKNLPMNWKLRRLPKQGLQQSLFSGSVKQTQDSDSMTYAHEASCSANTTNTLGSELNRKLNKPGEIWFGVW